jgi:hypothetical protein
VQVLNAIYEVDFLGFSYGFRPGRGQHDALDALAVGILSTKVNWIVDADIAGFFDAVSYSWLIRFVEHRVGDSRILRLIRKWLKAGVIEDGNLVPTEAGTPHKCGQRYCGTLVALSSLGGALMHVNPRQMPSSTSLSTRGFRFTSDEVLETSLHSERIRNRLFVGPHGFCRFDDCSGDG